MYLCFCTNWLSRKESNPSLESPCAFFVGNISYQECYVVEACDKVCRIDGMLATICLIVMVLILILILHFLSTCLKAFKSPAEITMLRGELQPLVVANQ